MAISNNLILYGPPGTGKTYNTVNYAVAIIEGRTYEDVRDDDYDLNLEKFNRYKALDRIGFVTFHQSLGYDDFIEGIKPVASEDGESLLYVPTPGTFYEFCRRAQFPRAVGGTAPANWDRVGDSPRIWLSEGMPEKANEGDIVVSLDPRNDVRLVCAVSDGDLIPLKSVHFPGSLLRISRRERETQPCVLRDVTVPEILAIVEDRPEGGNDDCVFIIDEINRGNISRIFGELITLIESSRRKGMPECMEVQLAQMKVKFSIPQNVYLLGTMNTADKSLAALDTALRRRFEFVEMMPDPDSLRGRVISDVDLSRLLRTMNRRIEVLYDREHMLGQAYFFPVHTMPQLAECFMKKIIPQLQEYFFDDYEKIGWVMGKASDPRDCAFVRVRPRSRFQMMFDLQDVLDIVEDEQVFMNPDNYIQIYRGEDE